MDIRRPRTNDPREVERWEDEVSRQLNYLKSMVEKTFIELKNTTGQISIVGEDEETERNLWFIPGTQGLIGPQGLMGIPGRDGEDGEDSWSIPGKEGAPGLQGLIGPPGLDGIDGEDNCLSLRTGAHGSFSANDHPQYQLESEKDAASGYAGLDAVSRTTKGVDTTDDLIVDIDTKGLVLKDTQAPDPHYWRVTVDNIGTLITSDLGIGKP